MAFGWSLLTARGIMGKNPEDMEKFLQESIIDLIVHEVGHTLGLRHNFKASSTIDINKLTDKNFTSTEGISGSVMDYNAINLAPKGKNQANFFQTTLGEYDYWAIEYAYKPMDINSKISEKEFLERIAQKVADPRLQYGTDEDVFGFSTRGIDPSCNLWDLGNDQLKYFSDRLNMAQELWEEIPNEFERKGSRYQKFRLVFGQGITEYAIAAANLPKYIGGIYSYRDHIGDPNGRFPFVVVSAEKQRYALNLIIKKIFASDAFQFSPDLLNKLADENIWDFEGTIWRRLRIDYPIHSVVQVIQASALFRLYDPIVLQRVQDNEIRFQKEEVPFTMSELFKIIREGIWEELAIGNNINSFRRELQRMHLFILNQFLINSPVMVPHDAATLARSDMVIIKDQIKFLLSKQNIDAYTKAHLEETSAKIDAVLEAHLNKSL
jgi:hypothetical protein